MLKDPMQSQSTLDVENLHYRRHATRNENKARKAAAARAGITYPKLSPDLDPDTLRAEKARRARALLEVTPPSRTPEGIRRKPPSPALTPTFPAVPAPESHAPTPLTATTIEEAWADAYNTQIAAGASHQEAEAHCASLYPEEAQHRAHLRALLDREEPESNRSTWSSLVDPPDPAR